MSHENKHTGATANGMGLLDDENEEDEEMQYIRAMANH